MKLLYELDINSRQTVSVFARKIGVSKQGCSYKLRFLNEKNVIKQTIARGR